ncbi:MAG: DUF5677 domain-containing protein [Desulfobacterales bacterium]|nr:DUF5677 domain-containing protein [Desulfobacterales bacterium]
MTSLCQGYGEAGLPNDRIQAYTKKPARFCDKMEGSGRIFCAADPERSVLGYTMKDNKRSSAKEYFSFMCLLHEKTISLTAELHFDKNHPWHLHLVALYCSLIELTGSACILIKEGVGIGIPILLRSAVEAHLDFVNLLENHTYGYMLRASELKEWIKLLKESKGGLNPFLKDISDFPDTEKTLEKWEQEQEDLQKKGYRALSVYEKFDRANLEPVYRSVYNILCCYSHNNLRALKDRHVNISEKLNDFEVDLYSPIDYERILPYVDNCCGILIPATETIHHLLETNCIKEIDELKVEFQKHRNAITEQADEL